MRNHTVHDQAESVAHARVPQVVVPVSVYFNEFLVCKEIHVVGGIDGLRHAINFVGDCSDRASDENSRMAALL